MAAWQRGELQDKLEAVKHDLASTLDLCSGACAEGFPIRPRTQKTRTVFLQLRKSLEFRKDAACLGIFMTTLATQMRSAFGVRQSRLGSRLTSYVLSEVLAASSPGSPQEPDKQMPHISTNFHRFAWRVVHSAKDTLVLARDAPRDEGLDLEEVEERSQEPPAILRVVERVR